MPHTVVWHLRTETDFPASQLRACLQRVGSVSCPVIVSLDGTSARGLQSDVMRAECEDVIKRNETRCPMFPFDFGFHWLSFLGGPYVPFGSTLT